MYQIVLLENNVKIKVLHTYTRFRDANYRLGVLGNKGIYLPKKHVYKDKKLTEVNYKALLVKRRGDGDISITLRDGFGKIMEDLMNDPEWVALAISDYDLEEQYNVTGANRKLSAIEVINHVALPNVSDSNTKQIVMLNNKLVIEGENLHMITCKSVDECIRLYNSIRIYCFEKKVGNILFFGTIQKVDKKVWYKKIHDITGVGYNRLYRKSSR